MHIRHRILYVLLLAALGLVFSQDCTALSFGPESPQAISAAIRIPADDGFLLSPGYDCDPKMLIPGNTDIDPKMLLNGMP